MISYITELVALFEKYKRHIFGPALNGYRKNAQMDDTVLLSDKLYITGDMPDTVASGDVMNPDKNLCVMVSLYELASSGAWAQYGEPSTVSRTPISLAIWTADPMLREQIHICMSEFFVVNGTSIICGDSKSGVHWELDNVQSLGIGQSPDGLYSRMYTMWMSALYVPRL